MKTQHRAASRRPLAACLVLALGIPAADAAIVVQNCLDHGPGSLRQAVIDDVASDPIDLTQLACSTITLTTGRIDVQRALLIQGPGPDALTIDGAGLDRVFQQLSGNALALYGMTIRNGYSNGFGGGCVYSSGPLLLKDAVVRDCRAVDHASTAPVRGGGVRVQGALFMTRSAILDNQAYSALGTAIGGGASVDDSATLERGTISGNVASGTSGSSPAVGGLDVGNRLFMLYSTVSDNAVTGVPGAPGQIGGLRAMLGATILDSTVSGNRADGAKGGIYLHGTIGSQNLISNSTISGNSAGLGIGGLDALGLTAIWSSTIAFNTEGAALAAGLRISDAFADLQGTIIAANTSPGGGTHNIGLGTAGAIGGADNLLGPSAGVTLPPGSIGGDPRLLPLHDNGGPTRTHALRAGSPAENAGNHVSGLSTDQRGIGFPRVIGPAPDIGAFEGVDADSIFYSNFD